MNNETLLNGLNAQQLHAVTTSAPAALVLAGAGSGKTGVLTRRIAYIMSEQNVSGYNVLALTFTRKAAREMKERITKLVGEREAKKVWIGTFHAVSLRILEKYGHHLGYARHINVYDEIDQKDVIEATLSDLGSDIKSKDIIRAMQGYASDCDGFEFDDRHKVIIQEYRQRLKQSNAVDFSLILTETLELTRKFPDVFAELHDRFRYVFVDEYQDVDRTQYLLHEAIKPEYVFVVGDVDQSIYGWRGSDIQIVLDFEKSHAGAEVIILEQSYRCPANVIQLANNLINHNERKYKKELWTENGDGIIQVGVFNDSDTEASQVVGMISRLLNEGEKGSEIAVLTRSHAQHEAVVNYAALAGFPYRVVGASVEYWKRGGVRLLVSILKVLYNRRDAWQFRKVALTFLGFNDTQFMEMEVIALKSGMRLVDVIGKHHAGLHKLLEWCDTFEGLSKPLSAVLKMILDCIDVEKWYADKDLNTKAQEIVRVPIEAMRWELNEAENGMTDAVSFLQWLAEIELQADLSEDDDTVKIATIHAVKGLEFGTIFLLGMNEGKLPNQYAIKENRVDEERRLCYVAITRAKQNLYISSLTADVVGQKYKLIPASRFLKEMEATA